MNKGEGAKVLPFTSRSSIQEDRPYFIRNGSANKKPNSLKGFWHRPSVMAVAAFTLIAGPFGIERMLSHDDSNQVKPTPTEPVPTQVPTIEVVSAPNNDARVLVYNDRVCETNGQEITVQSGDTISGIVDDLRQSGKIDRDMPLTDAVDAISRVNNLANPDFIQVGQTIKEIACSPTN